MPRAYSFHRTLRIMTVVMLAALPAAADRPPVKQLAGPADDFGLMRLPSPQDLAMESKLSMTTVELDPAGAWRYEFVADAGAEFRLFLLRDEASDWQVELQRPDGLWMSSDREDLEPAWKRVGARSLDLGLPTSGLMAQTYANVGDGRWVISVESRQASAKAGDPRLTGGLLIVANQGPWSLSIWPETLQTVVGQSLVMRAVMAHDRDAQAKLTVEEAHAKVTRPDGSTRDWQLADGDHRIKASGGRALDFEVLPTTAGLHRVGLRLVGRDDLGSLVQRSVEVPIYVVDPPLALATGSEAGTEPRTAALKLEPSTSRSGSPRLRVEVPVHPTNTKAVAAGHEVSAKVYAELWGRDQSLNPVPVAWIGGMKYVELTADSANLPLELDARWIARAGAQPPYELRRLRVQDPDSSIPYAVLDRLPVESRAPTALLKSERAADIEIDDEMRYGPRPAWLDEASLQKVHPQETILLVHGYCSSDGWEANEHHFDPEPVERLQAPGDHSNNEFALEILNFMQGVNHFSTISHSQGGMASLHLFTHFWSGLDNSEAARPMQSVGTPYNGSFTMSNVSLLAGVVNEFPGFCDVVFDLTTLGAGIWLTGIPPVARDEVYFYRSRGQDLSPCYWTSPIIPGRDDGAVSTSEGYLTGGHDLGVTRKECHTDEMVHSFQLNNGFRNLQMANNARIWLPDPLEACGTASQSSSVAPSAVSLDASCSSVQSGSITSYSWTITGPSSHFVTGRQASVSLTLPGDYSIQLTVTSTGPSLTDMTTMSVYLNEPCTSGKLCPEK